jgi:hypothetical protein
MFRITSRLIVGNIEEIKQNQELANRINLPLAICVNNYYTKKPFKVKRISGVGEIQRFDGLGKIIYLFSDWTHTYQENCESNKIKGIPVHKYFDELMKTSDKFIDIYTETSKNYRLVKKNKNLPPESYLEDIENSLGQCRGGTSSPNFCPRNARHHYIDIRWSPNMNPLIKLRKRLWTQPQIFLKNYKEYINIITSPEKEYIKWAMNIIYSHPLIMKQLYKLEPSFRSQLVNIVLHSEWVKIRKLLPDILSPLEELEKNIKKNKVLIYDKNIYDNLWYGISYGYMFLMDLYFMARLFKQHDVSNSQDPPTSKYVIVYAGSAHIIMYKKILKKMGFKQKEHQVNFSEISCIDMTKISQPLFCNL